MSFLHRRELLTGALGLAAGGALPGGSRRAKLTALTGVTLIDGSGAAPVRGATVLLAGDRIVAAGRRVRAPSEANVIDLRGKYVIPGLWDTHTHSATLTDIVPPLHVVHGVTCIREMAGSPESHEVRRRIERGELVGPRMVIASNLIDGPPGAWPGSDVVTTEAEARAAVRKAHRERADFAKVYTYLAPDTYAAVASEARRLRLPFAGHVPARVPVQDAVRLGQHSVEHLYGLRMSTSARAAEIYAELAAMPADPAHPEWWGRRWWHLERDAVATYDPARAARLFDAMARRGTWASPTLATLQRFRRTPEDLLTDPVLTARLRYIPASVRGWWEEEVLYYRPRLSPEEVQRWAAYFQAQLRLLGAMAEAGVGVVAGTDAGGAYIFPGFDLHTELGFLVEAGLSPMAALRAASAEAARCAGLGRVSGTVTAGRFADLVILDADPLADIANTRRIHAVVSRGRYLGPDARASLLAAVETAARKDTPAVRSPTG
ncbi:amidohydrolase family protein [Nonomuraea sp. NPDC050790]|uniref:amidohydrolase family protein n=1 Tax=Nonomuraea sp. NPDC050790 TaxID=3364371 RepID=UPI003790F44A